MQIYLTKIRIKINLKLRRKKKRNQQLKYKKIIMSLSFMIKKDNMLIYWNINNKSKMKKI